MAFAEILNYIKGHNGVVAFDDYSYNAAFEMGYFDDEARAQDLDSIQYLEEGGLPIPEALHANLTEFIRSGQGRLQDRELLGHLWPCSSLVCIHITGG